ncbi:helix-turn-helix domain-containing protein [Mycobacterium sp. ITM-2016-00317]|uniref:helix-turn-helix domain-containing protein n=1 Tax=Mycobacterium sp. ITM-2016-00317 TaxID=2099694 RepID=UPI000D4A799D|nr:helix-turn-helix domain-containing protein [Mycobacterium sp. ITM-2016-00317]WNG90093.1 helix-turn-helix domain-containing protein [Mycobacterium sp. ITM-2016-00317]
MTEIFVLEPAAADEPTNRLPEGLPVDGPERGPLERALRKAGLAVVPLDAVIDPAATIDDRRQLRASATSVVNAASDDELDRLRAAVTADPDDGLDERFWGQAPDSTTAAQAVFADLKDQFAQRRQLSAESISRDEAAQLLDVAPQSVTAKLAAGKLIGFKVGREWRLPLWQFNPDDPSGALPDLDELQSVFPGGVVSLSRWMQREQPEFGGRTPRAEMVLHGSASVIALAQALTSAAW